MGYGRAIATNTLVMVIGRVITTFISLALTAILARSLGVYNFGEFNIAFAYVSLFGVFADFGFFQILVREIARHPDQEAKIVSSIMLLRSFLCIGVYALAAGLVWLFPYSEAVKQSAGFLALASLFLTLNSTMIAIFQVHHQMVKAVIGDVIGRVILFGGVFWAIRVGWTLPQLFFPYIIANALNFFITLGYARGAMRFSEKIDATRWLPFLHEAWPLGLSAALGLLYFKGDMVILSILKPPTDVGIYGAAYKVFEFLATFPGLFIGNVFPVMTRFLHTDRKRLQRLLQASFDILFILGVGISFGLIGVARQTIVLLVGNEFLAASTVTLWSLPITAAHVLSILSLALISIFVAHLWGFFLIAVDQQRALIIPGVFAVVISLGLNVLLIPSGSYLTAAILTVITETFILIVSAYLARKFLPAPLSWRRASRAVLAGAVMLAVLIALPTQPLVILIPLGVLVYGLCLKLLGVLDSDLLKYLLPNHSAEVA